jgi:hypothetical protein
LIKTESNDTFKQKIDYNNCLTNLACSIEKYFDIIPKHKSISEVDKLLEEKNQKMLYYYFVMV